MTVFRPTLAVEADLDALTLPKYASPKLDGVRCLITDKGPVTRSLKPIRNKALHEMLSALPVGCDGELIAGEMAGEGVFKRTTSIVSAFDADPSSIHFHVFDTFSVIDRCGSGIPYSERLDFINKLHRVSDSELWSVLPQTFVESPTQLHAIEAYNVAHKFEGTMLRCPNSPYKFGRSTRNEGYLLKVKRFHDAEAPVVGVVEQFTNTNERKVNALGLTERSTSKAGKVGADTLGALVCRWTPPGWSIEVEFEIGTGFTCADRAALWLIWRTHGNLDHLGPVKFKYQELTADGKPRFAVWLGFRDSGDMS